ncbi:hemagglutinin repeat-containing protein [Caldimonas sp.]|uniref:hemagglutinin repeat-containing protein n=1 Tax=Caldimonas sp. TaxID=2838790 RepID=UPI00391C2274
MRWTFRIGEQLTARVGRDLTIHSVQDTATYDSRHHSAGGSVTIGYGFAASASYSQARVNAEHASVSQHSGLRAGDGGFDVQVQGHTALQGGLIASTLSAVDEGRNRLTTGTLSTQDLTNRSEHEARGLSVSGASAIAQARQEGPKAWIRYAV